MDQSLMGMGQGPMHSNSFRRPAPDNHLGNTGLDIWNDRPYEWLYPCEGPTENDKRLGPLRPRARYVPDANRPQLVSMARGAERGVVALGRSQSLPSQARRGGGHVTPAPRQQGKRQQSDIWPASSQGPIRSVPSKEQLEWRLAASAAVKAATAVRTGAPSGGRPSRRRIKVPLSRGSQLNSGDTASEPAPVVEIWDSVSQAPSGGAGEEDWEALSAETCTQTSGPRRRKMMTPEDLVIELHLHRNRNGWYDHHNGRLFG